MKNFFLVTFLSSFINFLLIPNIILAQEGFPINGVTDNRENYYAFSNAKILIYDGEENNAGSKEKTVYYFDKLITTENLKASGFI